MGIKFQIWGGLSVSNGFNFLPLAVVLFASFLCASSEIFSKNKKKGGLSRCLQLQHTKLLKGLRGSVRGLKSYARQLQVGRANKGEKKKISMKSKKPLSKYEIYFDPKKVAGNFFVGVAVRGGSTMTGH